jgi:cellulose synthase/poly-beta-1,6-N-acetylglucosamine synthase-like glycosyltransferase
VIVKVLFWVSLGALVWTQVGYPLFAALLARVRGRPVRKGEFTPRVTLIVAAHNEESVIEWRLENLLALDYPPELLEIVVASDASTDGTDVLVAAVAEREPRVRLLRAPRGGKVAAQNLAVRQSDSEILAFSDANAQWKPDALRKLVSNFADTDVAYVCGGHFYEAADGTNREGTYWRWEAWLRIYG